MSIDRNNIQDLRLDHEKLIKKLETENRILRVALVDIASITCCRRMEDRVKEALKEASAVQ